MRRMLTKHHATSTAESEPNATIHQALRFEVAQPTAMMTVRMAAAIGMAMKGSSGIAVVEATWGAALSGVAPVRGAPPDGSPDAMPSHSALVIDQRRKLGVVGSTRGE